MAKKTKAKLPKTIAGVKVPKAVRTSGLLDELLNSPLGREILAEAIVAAAGAVASVLMKKRPSADQVAQTGEAIVDTGAEAASATKGSGSDGCGSRHRGLGRRGATYPTQRAHRNCREPDQRSRPQGSPPWATVRRGVLKDQANSDVTERG